MNIIELLFWFRRDQREARQEERDTRRLGLEYRQELHTLFDRDISAWQKLFDSERDEAKKEQLQRELLRRIRAQALLLDDAIVRHPDFQMMPSGPTTLLGEPGPSTTLAARLRALAQDLIRTDRPEQALHILSLIQEMDPGPDPWIRIDKAHAFEHMGKIDDAVNELNSALGQAQTRRRALAEKALLLVETGRQSEAMVVAEQMLAEGDDPAAAYVISGVAGSQGQHDRALQIIDNAAMRWPGDPSLLSMRLRLRVENDAPDVVQAANELLAVDPQDHEAYVILGERHLKEGQTQAAVDAAAKAVDLSPKCTRGRLLLSDALCSNHEFEKALAELDVAGQLDPANPWVPFLRARVLIEALYSQDQIRLSHRLVSVRLILSALSAAIEHPAASATFKAKALVVRAMVYLSCHAWEMGSADAHDATQLGLPQDFEELAVRKLEECTERIPGPSGTE